MIKIVASKTLTGEVLIITESGRTYPGTLTRTQLGPNVVLEVSWKAVEATPAKSPGPSKHNMRKGNFLKVPPGIYEDFREAAAKQDVSLSKLATSLGFNSNYFAYILSKRPKRLHELGLKAVTEIIKGVV
jgi:small nuclear ribonucleoprotein (snRNP)-like protein